MKWKFNNPFLVIALGTALPMMVMLVWALLLRAIWITDHSHDGKLAHCCPRDQTQ